MSTQDEVNPTAAETVETAETPEQDVNPVPAETPAPEESEVGWNDVPDPEDEPGEGNAKPDAADKPEEKPDTGTGGGDEPGGKAEDDDPYSFLDDLDGGQTETPAPAPADAPKPDGQNPEDKPTETPPAPPAPSAPSSLDDLNLDELIDGLPEGDLKNFANDYHDEAKMAAAMAVQILKKLGYDELRTDVKKYSGTAEDYRRSQAELQAMAAQEAFENAVLKEHPDARDIIAGAEKRTFAAWLKGQPKFMQQRFRDTSDPEEASDILARYKSSRDGQWTAQQRRASKFSGVRSASSAPRKRSDEDVSWNDVKDEDVPEY